MNYSELSREQLINKIKELELLTKNLLKEKEEEETLKFAWTGNLGHWYWNVKTNTVTFNPLKVMALGYKKEEVPEKTDYQFFTDRLHPDDYENTMNAMKLHLQGIANVYEVEYKIRAKDGSWKWFYDRGKITDYDKEGKPLFLSGIVFDITQKKEMQQELILKNNLLEELSITDELTKLKNRRAIMNIMECEIDKAAHDKNPLSIALFDIDDFKQINDTNGHLVGDDVIKEVSKIMMENVRKTDTVGRFGGEEFIIVFPNTDAEKATYIANRIRLQIMEYDFPQELKVTISGGVKEFTGECLCDFINQVDKNLYCAKNSGKNKIV